MMHKAGVTTITDVKALKRDKIICATFNAGAALCNLAVDFSYEGRHEVSMTFGSPRGHLPIVFDEPNDFQAPIRDFLRAVQAGEPGNGLEAIAANRACLAIEEAAA
jgi:predicted dehydrogenase